MSSLRERIIRIWKEDPLLKRVLRNTSYLFSSQVVVMALAMGQSILATQLLGAFLYGWITIITDFATNVNKVFSFRMNEFVVRYMGPEIVRKDYQKAGAFVKIAALTESSTSLFAFVVYLLVLPFGAKFIVKDSSSIQYFYLYGLFIIANIIYETSTGILQVLDRYRIQGTLQVIQSIATASIVTFAFFTQGDLALILIAYLVGKFILGFGSIIAAWKALNDRLGREWIHASLRGLPSFREMAGFTISTNLSATAKLLTSSSLESQLIGYFLNAKAAGIFAVVTNVTVPLMTPISQLIPTTYPEMTKSIAAKKWKELKQMLRRVTLISGGWTVFFFAFMAIFGRWILNFWGADFVSGYPIMLLMMFGYSFANIFFWNRSIWLSFGKANIPLVVIMACAFLKIGLAFVLLPMFGMTAEALLLSGNFVISVSILTALGMKMLHRAEKANPETAELSA
jgi:O-antigen/teichoic acid export membrane protein